MNKIKSFREYVEQLQSLNDITVIQKEVDWNLEMSAICRRAYDLPAPAPLFCNIKDCDPTFRVLGCPVGLSPSPLNPYSRIALSIGCDPTLELPDIIQEWSALPDVPMVKPRILPTGPCKENKLFGDEINLEKLPIPYIHESDGGRYINTYGIFIVQTPDGQWINWAISRAMLSGPRTIASVIIPTQDLGKIYKQWQDKGEDMPLALCLGVDPAISMIAGYPLPSGINECDVIGGWYGNGAEVVKCETLDLYVPASTEVVLEGHVSITERVPEGPMGEYGGYVWSGRSKTAPKFKIEAMTYRNDPIIPICVAGVPVEENHTNWGVSIAASIQNVIQMQFPVIRKCCIPLESAAHWFVVSVDRNRKCEDDDGLARDIAKAVWATKGGSYIPKVFIVDDDIDTGNLNQLVWAIATRHHPDRRELLSDQYIFPLVAYLSQEEKAQARSSRVFYNCLTHFHEWEDTYQPVEASFRGYREALQEKVIKNWSEYGFPEK